MTQLDTDYKNITFIFCISIAYAVLVLFPNFSAQWGFIDDHVIITALGKNHQLATKDIPHLMANIPEIGSIGSYPRVQPFYVLFTIAQAHFFGDQVFWWYTLRVIGFGVSIFIFTILSQKVFGKFSGILLIIVIASHQCWGDIWARIGPAEIYTTPLFALFCLAYWYLWNISKQQRTLWYFILMITGVLLLGVKENMLFVLPAIIFLVWRDWRAKKGTVIQFLMAIASIIWGIFIVYAIYSGLHHNGGVDFYGTPISLSYRFKMIYGAFFFSPWHFKFEYPAFIPFVFSFILYVVSKCCVNLPAFIHDAESLKQTIIKFFYAELALFLLWAFQIMVYFKNHIPNGSRYDFPGILFTDVAYFLVFFMIVKLVERFLSRKRLSTGVIYRVAKYMFLVVLLLLIVLRYSNFGAIYNVSLKNSITTQKFNKTLNRIIKASNKEPSSPIVFVTHWIWDYEPISALRHYLSIYGVKNPIAIKVNGYSINTVEGKLQKSLAEELLSISRKGAPQITENIAPKGTKFLPYYPLSIYKSGEPCFMIGFSGNPDISCTNLGVIYHKNMEN